MHPRARASSYQQSLGIESGKTSIAPITIPRIIELHIEHADSHKLISMNTTGVDDGSTGKLFETKGRSAHSREGGTDAFMQHVMREQTTLHILEKLFRRYGQANAMRQNQKVGQNRRDARIEQRKELRDSISGEGSVIGGTSEQHLRLINNECMTSPKPRAESQRGIQRKTF